MKIKSTILTLYAYHVLEVGKTIFETNYSSQWSAPIKGVTSKITTEMTLRLRDIICKNDRQTLRRCQ